MNIQPSTDKRHPSALYLLTGIERGNLAPDARQNYIGTNDYSILVTTEGQGLLQIEAASYRLEKESCWITEPGQRVRISAEGHLLEYFRLTFRMLYVPQLNPEEAMDAREPFPCIGELVCMPFSKLVDGVDEIYRHREETEESQRFYNHVRFEELLRYLLQQNDQGKRDREPRKAVEHSIEFVKQHYQESLTVDQLAADAYVVRWRYTQLFKELTGQIPLDYINSLRINRAKQLLLMTGDRIHEIAQNVGFNNEYYFNRRFKQSVGIAPGKYRNLHRDDLRVVSLFMEDYLLSLGLTPIVQWAHTYWGKQDYLGLQNVPTYDVLKDQVTELSSQQPDVILLRQCTGLETDLYEDCARIARTCVIRELGSDWRTTLRILGERLDRREKAEKTIVHYEQQAAAARHVLSRTLKGQTVAFLRVSAEKITVEKIYTAPVLFDDLEMKPHPFVRSLTVNEARAGMSWEQLSSLDADHIFFAFDKWHDADEGAERLQIQHPAWQALPAVRNNRAYEVDFMTWMNHGVIANMKKMEEILTLLA